MLHPRRPHFGAAFAVLALLIAGCGSSSDDDGGGKAAAARKPAAAAPATTTPAPDDTTATAAAPSRAEYIRRADQVCLVARGVSRRANEVVQKAFGSGSSTRAADAIDNYVPLFTQHQAKLKAIPRPAKGAHTQILDGLMKVMDGQIQALVDESKALRTQDADAMAQISEAQQQEVRFAEELGRQYGFKVCGRTPAAAAQG
jgi:hypothetical protein